MTNMLWKTVHKWHRTMGIISALFVIFLTVTGLMLNHTEPLNLKKRFVQNIIFLDLYDIKPGKEPQGFLAANHWITQVGERIYFDQKELTEGVNKLVGVVAADEKIIVAYDGQMLLLTQQGEVVEHLAGTEGVPAGMRAIGITQNNDVVIRGAHGDYLADIESLQWKEEEQIDAEWSKTRTVPKALLANLLYLYRGKGLPLERVILDMHSGRFLGGFGIYLVDAAAALFLLLSLSGVWMWFKRS
ncbi:MAG: PepSY domain-containing protein [Gammaproteobacteria bacterium]|nr:PepSY domain-containing protein [Gammaproteobacteria bacterium]